MNMLQREHRGGGHGLHNGRSAVCSGPRQTARRWTVCVLIAASLAACDSRPAPGPEIHDSKYTALDSSGAELTGDQPADQPGVCVLDRFTGLTWEVKSADGGLRDGRHTYSWYDPDEDASGDLDYRGHPNGGRCTGSACDTHSFVQAVNAATLCGHADWRMPTRDELGSISDPRKTSQKPTINSSYFPHTQAGEYWSGNDYQFHWDTAWLWNFETGLDRVEWKHSPRHVRLVRGQATYLERIED